MDPRLTARAERTRGFTRAAPVGETDGVERRSTPIFGALAAVLVVALLLVWWLVAGGGAEVPQVARESAAPTSAPSEALAGSAASAAPATGASELAAPDEPSFAPLESATELAPVAGERSVSSGDARLVLDVVASPMWIEKHSVVRLGPATLVVPARAETYLGQWRGDRWRFELDGLAPGPFTAHLATPSAPRLAHTTEPLVLELAAGDNTHTVDLGGRGQTVTWVLVYDDDARREVARVFGETGVDFSPDTTGASGVWAELRWSGTPVALAPFERVASERFASGDIAEARFDAVPDGDYELHVVCGLERHVSVPMASARVHLEPAYVRSSYVLDFAPRTETFAVELRVDGGGFLPESIDVVVCTLVPRAVAESSIAWTWNAAVVDGSARFEVPTLLAEPHRVVLSGEGTRPVFVDGERFAAGGAIDVRFERGSGGLVLGTGRFGAAAAAPAGGLTFAWHGEEHSLDLFGCAEVASDVVLPLDATVVIAPELWPAKFGATAQAPQRVVLREFGRVLLVDVRP